MKVQIRVLSGARAGVEAVFAPPRVAIGRHPASDLQLDPDHDLDVSGRHAELIHADGRWMLRDAGSSNGTLVNGHPVSGDTRLDDTDQIQLGAQGPKLEVRLVADATPDRAPRYPPSTPTGIGRPTRPADRAPEPAAAMPQTHHGASTTQRIRLEVGRQTKRLRAMTVALFVVLIAVVGYFVVSNRLEEQARARDAAAMQVRIDSILRTSAAAVESLQGQVEGLATALQNSRAEVQRLQGQIRTAEASGDHARVADLERQLASTTTALRDQQMAAGIPYGAINDANQRAVALIWVEFAPGEVYTGTAFAVTPDGKLITNRHVVADTSGTRTPTRIAVEFANSSQIWRARLLAVSHEADLAAVQVMGLAGTVPVVKGLDSDAAVSAGDPVASIGFPLGVDLATRAVAGRSDVRTTLTSGIVSKVLPDLVQIDGYGTHGASGSPIFDRNGNLVSVLYGGEKESDGRIVFSVPVRYVRSLMRQIR